MSRAMNIGYIVVALAATCCVWQSAAPVSSFASDGGVRTFCSKPAIGIDEGAPAIKARLGIFQKTVRQGGTVRVRIEDIGTTDLTYNLSYELERRSRGSWVKLPRRPVFAPRLYVRAGMSSDCQSIDIPRHASTGRYRIVKQVRPVGRKKDIVVKTTFSVLPHR